MSRARGMIHPHKSLRVFITTFLCLFSNSMMLYDFSLRFIKQILAKYLGSIFFESQVVKLEHESYNLAIRDKL